MKVFIILNLMLAVLYANNSFKRVLITKTTDKSNLGLIKKQLDRLSVRMFVQPTPSGYYVYSKKFSDDRALKYNLRKIKHVFPYAKIIIPSKKPNKENKENKVTNKSSSYKNNYFVRLGVANSSINGSTNDTNASSMDNSSLGYSVELGYIYNKNLFFTGGYMDNSTDDISLLNLYATANYNYNIYDNLGLYIGGILGYSELELTNYKLNTPSKSLLYGIQLGAGYNIFDYLNIFTTYQIFMLDHSIEMEDIGSTIEFDSLNNFMIGVGYEF